jgi:uncharacterized membrane protein
MDPVGRRAALALLSLAATWGLVLPWLACARGSSSPLLSTTGRAALALGHVICHQRAERSFFSCGLQWPVCGRCSGLYLGAAAGAVLALALHRRPHRARSTTPGSVATRWRRILLFSAAPTAVLWTIEFAGLFDPGTTARFAGALPLGLAASGWLDAVARGDLR